MGAIKSRLLSPSWTKSDVVKISQGEIQGRRYTFAKGNVDAFLGIPFAEPPINELRFQKPVPAKGWDDVRQCTQFGPRCPHDELLIEKLHRNVEKNEDCLRLNVFAPEWSAESSGQTDGFAVLVFVHGGGFAVHSAAHYGDYGICDALCCKDVVVVTIQYRLGFFGFSAGEGIASNIGLWDQTLALQWVKDNVHSFGGNPNNITVFGQSAGGACTDLLMLSPHSRDLFQKAIPMAGTALCSFSLNDEEHVAKVCLKAAIKKGYNPEPVENNENGNKEPVYSTPFEFLRTLPAATLQVGIFGTGNYEVNRNGKIDLTPVFDKDFFPKPVEELRKEAPKKIIMTGVTEHEGLLFVGMRPAKLDVHAEVDKLLDRELIHHNVKDIETVKEKLMTLYTKGVDSNNKKEVTKAIVKIVSDIFINNGNWLFADKMTKLGHTVYQYCFEYCNPNDFGLIGFMLPYKKATHGTEMPYIFKKSLITTFIPSAEDEKVVETMTTFFTNFAKYGNPNGNDPTPELQLWKPLSPDNTLKYLSINLDKVRMCENLNDGRSYEWQKLVDLETNIDNADEASPTASIQGKL
uniref:Carboxylic ester hydrolase n=1 Tax=Panagrellus redivivus TaxID=6233 RepID=A0A7E4V2D1_PANRE